MLADVLVKIAGMEAPPEAPYRPRPSSSGPDRCLRQLVYKARGFVGKPIGDRFIMVLDDSSWHEELTADWIRKSAFQLLDQQLAVSCGTTTHMGQPYEVTGSIDGIIKDLVRAARLWEHKAINHFSFERMLKGEYPMDYLTQCCLYITGLRKQEAYKDLQEAVLLVKNKNTSAYLEFLMAFDPEQDVLTIRHIIGSDGTVLTGPVEFHDLYTNAFKRFEFVEAHRAAGTLPARQYDRTSDWQCDYCPYAEICYEGYEDEFTAEVAALDDDALAKAEEFREISDSLSILKKRQEDLKKELKAFLVSKGAAKARANGTVVGLTFQKRKSTDTKLIPPEILAAAQAEKTIEVFKVGGAKAAGR